jgi:hypothetical protein
MLSEAASRRSIATGAPKGYASIHAAFAHGAEENAPLIPEAVFFDDSRGRGDHEATRVAVEDLSAALALRNAAP